MNSVFQSNKGDHSVVFEVLELEKTKKQIEIIVRDDELEELILDENGDSIATENIPIIGTTEVEETKVRRSMVLLRDAGVTWIRQEFPWDRIEPSVKHLHSRYSH